MQEETAIKVANFCFYPPSPGFVLNKPIQWGEYKESLIYELEKAGRLIMTRKRNGWKLFAVKWRGEWHLYTDGLNEIKGKFEHIKRELAKLNLPDPTMLVGEGHIEIDGQGMESRGDFAGMVQSSPEKALLREKKVGRARFMVFDTIFVGGKYCLDEDYEERLARIGKMLAGRRLKHIVPMTVLPMSYDEAKKLVRKKGWEGLVLYDKKFRSAFRLDGKSPQRVPGCYKWKPLFEGDFIVRQVIMSPEHPDRLKEVVLLQIDPENGREFYCGKFGNFTRQMREELNAAKYPLVMEIVYEERHASGAISNTRFGGLRPDKTARDCLAPKSYPKAKYI